MMDEIDSGGWLLNPDFDEGSLVSDFNCEDYMNLTNPACSPEQIIPDSAQDFISDAWKETYSKLKALQRDQNKETVMLGSGFVINDTDEFHFNPLSTDIDTDYESELSDPANDCPCCGQKFRYRHEVVSHLEKVHFRCSDCEYKFETSDDLILHKETNCGMKSYRDNDDDNLSISGDEDTTTLEDMRLEEARSKKVIVDKLPASPGFDFDDELDNKDLIQQEIALLEEQHRLKNLTFPRSGMAGVSTSPLHPGTLPPGSPLNTPVTPVSPLIKRTKPVEVKTETVSDDECFEFESGGKRNAVPKIRPNSLLKKRLRPAMSLSAKLNRNKQNKLAQMNKLRKPVAAGMQPSKDESPKPDTESTEPVPTTEQSVVPEAGAAEEVETKEDLVPVAVKEETVDAPVPSTTEPDDLEGELTCSICELTVEGYLEMEKHTRIMHSDDRKNYGVNCVVCDTLLPNLAALDVHESEKHKEFAYKCGDCSKIFNSQSAFKAHEKFHNNYKQCDMCDKKFINADKLNHHQENRCLFTEPKCVQCNLMFDSLTELKAHKDLLHKKVYRCEKCGKEFNQKQMLAVHKMSHTGEEKPFKCKVCGKGFKTYWYYVVHEKCYCKHKDNTVPLPPTNMEPSKKKFYQCKICSRVFPHISHLKVHNYIHTGERPYKCGSCGKGFTQKQNLKVHERVHTGEKPYICNSCGFGFKDLGNLRRHQYIHTGEKPHGCDICGKRFTWVESLRRHKRTHLKQRPYQCKICKREFVHHGHLRIHELVHKDEKPFQCNICGKAFTMLSSLSIHEHIHLERKPYPCDMCQRTFMTASALTTHKQSHVQRMANAYRQACRDRFSF